MSWILREFYESPSQLSWCCWECGNVVASFIRILYIEGNITSSRRKNGHEAKLKKRWYLHEEDGWHKRSFACCRNFDQDWAGWIGFWETRKVTHWCVFKSSVDSSNLQKSPPSSQIQFGFQFSSHFSVEMILFLKRACALWLSRVAKPKKLKNVKITKKMMIRWILKIGFRLTHGALCVALQLRALNVKVINYFSRKWTLRDFFCILS